jgi:hypothetical protein
MAVAAEGNLGGFCVYGLARPSATVLSFVAMAECGKEARYAECTPHNAECTPHNNGSSWGNAFVR